MKRSDLVRHLKQHGCVLDREGKEHTLFKNPVTGRYSAVPRHHELNNFTAFKICKDLDVPRPSARG